MQEQPDDSPSGDIVLVLDDVDDGGWRLQSHGEFLDAPPRRSYRPVLTALLVLAVVSIAVLLSTRHTARPLATPAPVPAPTPGPTTVVDDHGPNTLEDFATAVCAGCTRHSLPDATQSSAYQAFDLGLDVTGYVLRQPCVAHARTAGVLIRLWGPDFTVFLVGSRTPGTTPSDAAILRSAAASADRGSATELTSLHRDGWSLTATVSGPADRLPFEQMTRLLSTVRLPSTGHSAQSCQTTQSVGTRR